MRSNLLTSVACLAIVAFGCHRPAPVAPRPAVEMEPVTIELIDARSKKPVGEFQYQYWITSSDQRGNQLPVEWQVHKEADGPLRILAPKSCVISISWKATDYIAGFRQSLRGVYVKSTDVDRNYKLELRRGDTISGVVLDAETKLPIEGATVTPSIFTPPGISGDRERAAVTDEQGRFTVRGVEPGLGMKVEHPDYVNQNVSLYRFGEDKFKNNQVLLKSLDPSSRRIQTLPATTFKGKVITRAGAPIVGAKIRDEHGKFAETDKNGVFSIRCSARTSSGFRAESYFLHVEKDGFISQRVDPEKPDPNAVLIALEPMFELRGHVVGQNGQPVGSFSLIAEPDKRSDRDSDPPIKLSGGTDGFVLRYSTAGKRAVVIRADGYAPWLGTVEVSRDLPPTQIALTAGVEVKGAMILPPIGNSLIRVGLLPDKTPANDRALFCLENGEVTAPVEPDGTFRLSHVDPGGYRIIVLVNDMELYSRPLTVAGTGADLKIELPKTGRIIGQIFKPSDQNSKITNGPAESKPWLFASCKIVPKQRGGNTWELHFMADENGRFDVGGVPIGDVIVQIPYRATADIVDAHQQEARVEFGAVTEVHLFDPAFATPIIRPDVDTTANLNEYPRYGLFGGVLFLLAIALVVRWRIKRRRQLL
jgi:hypothetical protein